MRFALPMKLRNLVLVGLLAPWMVAASCNDYGYYENTTTDVFHQNRRHAVDLLVVIDNSCSMVEEQDNLARNFDALISTFAAADVDWQLAVTTTDTESARYKGLLQGGDDEIILRTATGEIDRVDWDRTWAWTNGTSLQLKRDTMRPTSNDALANWCPSTATFAQSKGTPGAWNTNCDGTAVTPPSGGTDAGPRAPHVGDLVITEIMAASAGLDSKCEWFEVTNLSSDTLDVSGLEIADMGRNHVVVPDATTIAPYKPFVVGRSTDTAENCGTPVDLAFAEGMTLAQDVRVINNDTPDGSELFSELVAQGTIGSGIEMGLEGGRLVFTEPYFSDSNQGFLRDDANLSILFVSDEQDQSPYSADAYVRNLVGIKGETAFRDRDLVTLSAVVGKDPPPSPDLPSCHSANGYAGYGSKYLAVVAATNGLAASICTEDFAPIVTELGLTLSGLEVDFELSEWPQAGSLAVALYATEASDSKIKDLVEGVDYTYIADGNKIHFNADQVPPSEDYIVARYHVSTVPPTDTAADTDTDTDLP